MTLAGIRFCFFRTLTDKAWWIVSLAGAAASLSLGYIYAKVLASPNPGQPVTVLWQELFVTGFMAWSALLLATAISASIVAGRDYAAGAEAVTAWLFPCRGAALISQVIGIALPSTAIGILTAVALLAILAGQAPGSNIFFSSAMAMALMPTLSVFLASVLGSVVVVLARSTVFALVSLIAVFWVLPGIFAAANVPADWLPATGMLAVAVAPLRRPTGALLLGAIWTPALFVAAMVRLSRREVGG